MLSTTLRFLPRDVTVVKVEIDPHTNEVTLHLRLKDEPVEKEGETEKPMKIIMTPAEREMLRQAGSIGGKLSSSRMSKKKRAARARQAALTRWGKPQAKKTRKGT